ncbi:DUF2971 domain-containing protein [Bordetella petrii]|uniref:DUF2971 domain-containing protein n=1 Tax=Bordetella petrii TaxID=94624 RepID=UPI001E63D9A3|nr:DUF2971 domain-containing protein [Bordetella petrii]MCD0502770.1 DUF2971 domain-containing protein [Bordetella petrii]
MRLYYMTSLATLERYILPDMRIRISTFDRVNDPFELLSPAQKDRRFRRHFSALYEYWVGSFGFISLSQRWKSPLMWAHYAERHTGVCLGIDVATETVKQVSYKPKRLDYILDKLPLEVATDEDVIRTVATTKYEEWKYEQEWRYLTRLNGKGDENGYHYIPFNPAFELREIILGARCQRDLDEVRKLVVGNTEEIKIMKVRAAFGTFEMVQQQLHGSFTISPLHQVNGIGTHSERRRRQIHRKRCLEESDLLDESSNSLE